MIFDVFYTMITSLSGPFLFHIGNLNQEKMYSGNYILKLYVFYETPFRKGSKLLDLGVKKKASGSFF